MLVAKLHAFLPGIQAFRVWNKGYGNDHDKHFYSGGIGELRLVEAVTMEGPSNSRWTSQKLLVLEASKSLSIWSSCLFSYPQAKA